ncbi:hypothetical protein [Streptomyces sp. NPDC047070]|uniref:hypothetical protein n=1 Tax=Streptomyces sp. NPDC047070 TaxID=3154923 RepID=UPI003454E9F1
MEVVVMLLNPPGPLPVGLLPRWPCAHSLDEPLAGWRIPPGAVRVEHAYGAVPEAGAGVLSAGRLGH